MFIKMFIRIFGELFYFWNQDKLNNLCFYRVMLFFTIKTIFLYVFLQTYTIYI